jgi:hypothetical protein
MPPSFASLPTTIGENNSMTYMAVDTWQKKHEAAWVYSGILMHMYGLIDLSGLNGLGRYKIASKKDSGLLDVVRNVTIDRTYGGVPTDTDKYTGLHLDWKLLDGGVFVNQNGREAAMAVEGTLGLVLLMKKARNLVKHVPGLGKEIEKQLDRLIKFFERSGMPKIEFIGEGYINLGLNDKDVPFYRVGVEGKAVIKIQQKKVDEILKKLGVPTSATTGGRSWQIDLRRINAHLPRQLW